jgi:hypothetical protein
MADVIIDGYINIWLVPTIPNIAAPVAATIAAGNAIELLLTPDGLAGFESTTNWVNNSALGSTFDTQLAGHRLLRRHVVAVQVAGWGGHAVEPARSSATQTNVVIRRRILRTTAIAANAAG